MSETIFSGAVARPSTKDNYHISKDGRILGYLERLNADSHYTTDLVGNSIVGHWALLDIDGAMIDHDRYRHDIASLYQFTIKGA